MKLELTTETKIAIWKIGNAALMCQDNDITSAKYEEISLEAMNEANDAHLKSSNCNIPHVSVSLPTPEEIWEKADEMLPTEFTRWYKKNVGYKC